jgi:aryl-alcohol dehydrogenase-like predicted oxidoreductase
MPAQTLATLMATLALGTVQFGLPYGIANSTGQISATTVEEILAEASQNGIDTLDTAVAYGESESRLGAAGMQGWQVVSKLPPLPPACADVAGWVDSSLDGSLGRLRVSSLKALLLHRSQDLLGPSGETLYRSLEKSRDERRVSQIGVSVYSPEDLEQVERRFAVDIVQFPLNIVDRRFERSGTLRRLAARGVEVHVRSVFLQGLLLMNESARPARFAPWADLWRSWNDWLAKSALTPLEACLGFALSRPGVARAVVGVDGVHHLRQIIDASRVGAVEPPAVLSNDDPQLINPLSWLSS